MQEGLKSKSPKTKTWSISVVSVSNNARSLSTDHVWADKKRFCFRPRNILGLVINVERKASCSVKRGFRKLTYFCTEHFGLWTVHSVDIMSWNSLLPVATPSAAIFLFSLASSGTYFHLPLEGVTAWLALYCRLPSTLENCPSYFPLVKARRYDFCAHSKHSST